MNRLYVIMYHYVRDLENSRYPNIKGLDYHFFKEQIIFLKENFNIVSMENVLESFNTKIPLPDKSILLTFDDGYIDHYTHVFPILMNEKIQGSFFIPGKAFTEHKLLDVNKIHFILASVNEKILLKEVFNELDYFRGLEYILPSNRELFDTFAEESRFDNKEIIFIKRLLQTALPEQLRNIISSNLFEKFVGIPENKFAKELYLNHDQIIYMKNAGMHFGLHGYDHYWLANLNSHKLVADISKALDVMSPYIDKNSWTMCYPYGSNNNDVIEYIKAKGCSLAFTTDVRVCDLLNENPYKLPRLDTNDFPPKSCNYIEKRFINE